MLLRIAWRNIWRNKSRSMVIMIAIALGILSIIFLVGMVYGMVENYIKTSIENEISHLKIQHPDFPKDSENIYFLTQNDSLLKTLEKVQGLKSFSSRSFTTAMMGSSYGNRGIKVYGVRPDLEMQLSGIPSKIVEGTYLTDLSINQIVIGKRLAKFLKVKLKSKVVLTFQNLNGEMTYGAFKIVGLFDTNNYGFDESLVFVNQESLNQLLGKENITHELDIMVENLKDLPLVKSDLQKTFPGLLVRNYEEIQPELALFESQIKLSGIIYMLIFMLALVFGIINTMMMAVLERVKELGMLMAVGMNKTKVFSLILLETLLLALVAAPVGIGAGYIMMNYFEQTGINLFFYTKEGMSQFGFDTFIYPRVPSYLYVQLAVAISATAVLGSLYPAWKAIRLRPVDAIRGQFLIDTLPLYKRILNLFSIKKHRK